ncbi:SRPBCC family protein [Sphingobium fuliginis]|uniref:Aha1 domain protein n=1 Tax=Sphingobium fuliginis (strain ATCC 27551) TaxID=336203 RepID=A0A292ZCL7_SPHSA|nr:SRPBCC domain-containing protein [Sphingobium fuliginis]GAY20631.1 Aha1 domain protein [Sphingobium fuliginis]
MTDQIQSSIVIERTYAAQPQELWSLWTTKDGFQSWWGPEGFRADVSEIDARPGGALRYEMVADSAEMVVAMKDMGQPTSTDCNGRFSEFRPFERLVLTQVIDFIPGVQPYDSIMEVDFIPSADGKVRMIVTLSQMHDLQTTQMQQAGFTSQLSKLDRRFGWSA